MDEPLYDGNQPQWINETVSLTDYLNEDIFIRFKLYTDGGLRRDGFYFDNFKIKGVSENLGISEIEQVSFNIYPNPTGNYINIRSEVKINKLEIFDLMGKKLLEIEKENIDRARLPKINSGVYIVKLFSDEGISNHRIIKK